MALSRNETGITWSAAASITLSSSTQQMSDAFSFNAGDIQAALQINADNSGTPQAGDVLNVRIAWTTGDILGDSNDDYDTAEHAESVAVLDTVAANTPGEDPARMTVVIPTAAKGFKVAVDAPQAASRNIVVRARVITQRES